MSQSIILSRNLSAILVFLMFGLAATAQTAVQPEVEHRETIQSRAAQAKAEGKTSVTFPLLGTSYPTAAGGLKHAASEFSVVVGTPRALQTIVENDDTTIATWYSIAISEVIAARPCSMCPLLAVNGMDKSVQPTSLLPAPDHSMLLLRRGGTVTRDGISVTETENQTSALTVGKKYLFVVDRSENGIARLVLNDKGIFVVGDDGETLSALTADNSPKSASSDPNDLPTIKELRDAAKVSAKGPAGPAASSSH